MSCAILFSFVLFSSSGPLQVCFFLLLLPVITASAASTVKERAFFFLVWLRSALCYLMLCTRLVVVNVMLPLPSQGSSRINHFTIVWIWGPWKHYDVSNSVHYVGWGLEAAELHKERHQQHLSTGCNVLHPSNTLPAAWGVGPEEDFSKPLERTSSHTPTSQPVAPRQPKYEGDRDSQCSPIPSH